LAILAGLVVSFFISSLEAQAGGTPPQQSPVKGEEPQTVGKGESSEKAAPAIDPDVQQWFLEKLRKQNPLDPRDVEILTGRTRDREQIEFQRYDMGYWFPPPWVAASGQRDLREPALRSRFLRPGFMLFGRHRWK
jgi:hypothetical protein